jgi:hypothetical protein
VDLSLSLSLIESKGKGSSGDPEFCVRRGAELLAFRSTLLFAFHTSTAAGAAAGFSFDGRDVCKRTGFELARTASAAPGRSDAWSGGVSRNPEGRPHHRDRHFPIAPAPVVSSPGPTLPLSARGAALLK